MNAFFMPKCLTFGKDISRIVFTEQTVHKTFKTAEIYETTVQFYSNFVRTAEDQRLFPKIIGREAECRTVIFAHCGDLLNLWTLPADWETQLNALRSFFKERQVLILDIRFMPHTPYVINNLCVKNNRIYLVDVGFYTKKSANYIDDYFDHLISKIHIYNRVKTWKWLIFPLHIFFYISWLITDFIEKMSHRIPEEWP